MSVNYPKYDSKEVAVSDEPSSVKTPTRLDRRNIIPHEKCSFASTPAPQRLHVKPTILTLAGSARRDALNKQLARIAAEQASGQGAEGTFIDLADYPPPLYDGDFEQSDGIPNNAVQLAELIKEADGLLIASHEYNGATHRYSRTPIDWVTRVDYRAFAKPTAIAS